MNPCNLLSTCLGLLALAATPATAQVVFGSLVTTPGQRVQMVSKTTTEGGTVELILDGRTRNGTIQYSRNRELSWTFRDPEPDGTRRGMVSVAKIETYSSATIDGISERSDDLSPLNGRLFAMSRPPGGDWKFELDGSLPQQRVKGEIAELTTYINRKWYPQRPVSVGDSWEFDPSWIRMLIERDLPQAQTVGTMSLRSTRNSAARHIAIIDVSIRSTGAGFRADGTESSAQVTLKGESVVNLRTMLEESLELKGTVVTRNRSADGTRRTVTLPVTLTVTKTIVRN
jgi:hypothetical protein